MALARHAARELDPGPSIKGATPPAPPSGIPLAHLWFLYYLLLLYGTTLAIRACFINFLDREANHRVRIDGWVHSWVHGYAAPVLLAAPIATCLYFTPNWIMWSGIPSPDNGLTPQLPAMIGFGTAFAFGWLIQRQSELLSVWKQRWAMHLVLASALTAVSWWIAEHPQTTILGTAPFIKLAYVACYAAAIWNWIFGLIGTALRAPNRIVIAQQQQSESRAYDQRELDTPVQVQLSAAICKANTTGRCARYIQYDESARYRRAGLSLEKNCTSARY